MSGLVIRGVKDLNYWLWSSIVNKRFDDEIAFTYLMYDLNYELGNTEAYFVISDATLKAFILIWRNASVHMWGCDEYLSELIKYVPISSDKLYIQTYSNGVVNDVINYVSRYYGKVDVIEFIDMITDERSFRPYKPELAVKLSSDKENHVKELAKVLKELKGSEVSPGEAKELLSNLTYYGIFINDELVSIANTYVRTKELWLVGSVYTKPEFRGRGYAKAVTSAVTEVAIKAGAKAALHVREGNIPAIKAYERIGYRRLRKRKWIICSKQ